MKIRRSICLKTKGFIPKDEAFCFIGDAETHLQLLIGYFI